MSAVIERFEALRIQQETINLYALVDGHQYERHFGERMRHQFGINRPILAGTEDEPLSHAGPWLIDVAKSANEVQALEALEHALPSISWILTSVGLEGLSELLQLKLSTELPDGRPALLRFYDPRVLGNLCRTMNDIQREEFFHLIDEWHFIHNGQTVVMGTDRA